ncbi:hypothetical protein GE09DRAFT_1294815 [Coniochaeta sp. 2T2.1]|nr:hypothetical protein GE09DRAFT_1294815 [Coniochaeta sp. 2T2.1]
MRPPAFQNQPQGAVSFPFSDTLSDADPDFHHDGLADPTTGTMADEPPPLRNLVPTQEDTRELIAWSRRTATAIGGARVTTSTAIGPASNLMAPPPAPIPRRDRSTPSPTMTGTSQAAAKPSAVARQDSQTGPDVPTATPDPSPAGPEVSIADPAVLPAVLDAPEPLAPAPAPTALAIDVDDSNYSQEVGLGLLARQLGLCAQDNDDSVGRTAPENGDEHVQADPSANPEAALHGDAVDKNKDVHMQAGQCTTPAASRDDALKCPEDDRMQADPSATLYAASDDIASDDDGNDGDENLQAGPSTTPEASSHNDANDDTSPTTWSMVTTAAPRTGTKGKAPSPKQETRRGWLSPLLEHPEEDGKVTLLLNGLTSDRFPRILFLAKKPGSIASHWLEVGRYKSTGLKVGDIVLERDFTNYKLLVEAFHLMRFRKLELRKEWRRKYPERAHLLAYFDHEFDDDEINQVRYQVSPFDKLATLETSPTRRFTVKRRLLLRRVLPNQNHFAGGELMADYTSVNSGQTVNRKPGDIVLAESEEVYSRLAAFFSKEKAQVWQGLPDPDAPATTTRPTLGISQRNSGPGAVPDSTPVDENDPPAAAASTTSQAEGDSQMDAAPENDFLVNIPAHEWAKLSKSQKAFRCRAAGKAAKRAKEQAGGPSQ